MQRDPPPFVWAVPDEKNILNWHFLVRGPPDSAYADGEYHGMIMFPSEYPFKPPGIKMITPSGRFTPNHKICFSMSDYHPGTWNPAWSVATILTGLLSFMLSEEITAGGMQASEYDRKHYAKRSHAWNIQQKLFRAAFPEYSEEKMKDLPNMGEKERGASDAAPKPAATPIPSTLPHNEAELRGPARRGAVKTHQQGTGDGVHTWASTLRRIVLEKWRWGAFLVIAIIVSRYST